MTHKKQLKNLLEHVPEEKGHLIETFIRNLLGVKELNPPKGRLGLKKPFDRKAFYDDTLVDRY